MRNDFRIVFAILFYSVLSAAHSAVEVSATAVSGNPPSNSMSLTDGIRAIASAVDESASSYAEADLEKGLLKASVTSAANDSSATVIIRDRFTFSEGASGIAYLDWSFHGGINTSNTPGSASTLSMGIMHLSIGDGATPAFTEAAALFEFDCWRFNYGYGQCFEGSAVATQGTIEIPISSRIFSIDVSLSVRASQFDVANFSNTGLLYLRLPEGVTITSDSGAFLALAAPIPEPEMASLLVAGLAVMAFFLRRRDSLRRT